MRVGRHARWIFPLVAVVAIVATAAGALAWPQVGSGVVGGFNRQDTQVNRPQVIGIQPALTVAHPESSASAVPWVALAEQERGSNRQNIFARTFNAATQQWVTRGTKNQGGSLNVDTSAIAEDPAIALAGPVSNGHGTIPFVVWYEPVRTLQDKNNIFVSKFVTATVQTDEFWQLTGDTAGHGFPTLNHDAAQDAEEPRIAGGSVNASATSFAPWVTWQETSTVASGARQIFVSRAAAASGPTIDGGLQWIPTGKTVPGIGPSLNFNVNNDATQPDIVFSGPNNTVPWAIWQEQDTTSQHISRIFASKAIADASAGVVGGFRWDIQPACTGIGQNCALNRDFFRSAMNPRIATGALAEDDQTKPKPWAVWQEFNGNAWQIFVSRFDGTNWIPVGDSLNILRFENASTPDIYFVGNVPHVAFIEEQGGQKLLFVRHLADARPGFERWDLDAVPYRGINVASFNPAARPALRGTATTPMVAWQESVFWNPTDTSIFEAKRLPDGPAWGTNRPPFIRIISGTVTVALNNSLTLADDKASAPQDTERDLGPITIVTSCDHVNGWDNITEIQTKLANNEQTVFVGRYVAAENKIYIQDPDHPDQWLGGETPGPGASPIQTKYVNVHVDQMEIAKHGPGSPAVDIKWVLDFRPPAQLQEYGQFLDIFYKDEQNMTQSTDFFEVGSVRVATNTINLPGISRAMSFNER